MVATESLAIFLGAIILGLVHGAEPGHGWPIAATYALNRSNTWWSGVVASSLLGLGHLMSSLAVVAVFFLAKSYLNLTQLNTPLTVGGIQIGGPVSLLAGALLILLGIREYRQSHTHDHSHGHDHSHDHDAQTQDHDQTNAHDQQANNPHGSEAGGTQGVGARITRRLPFADDHSHNHLAATEDDSRGLFGIVWTAFVLGFAHEEEFEIIGLCLGSDQCLALMVTYAVAVLVALVGLTMIMIAGYQQSEERLEGLTDHFPLVSAVVLIGMGVGFILGMV